MSASKTASATAPQRRVELGCGARQAGRLAAALVSPARAAAASV
jgi:hypothetical protein